ncbi:MAG: DUF167 family protein [Hyphomicrobiales bacterium]|nr:DUF167 family protein [Hyphomicrobiales bacterium]
MAAAAPSPAISRGPDGLRLRVRLTPRARRDALGAFETLADGNQVMLAHVRALPADGRANAALVVLVAESLGLAKTKVEVVSGQTSRVKMLRLDGDADRLAAALEDLAARAAS